MSGKWTKYYGVNVTKFHQALGDILREFGDAVYIATEDGLTAAEKVLIENLKANTPKRTGRFKKGWTSKGKKYKLRRYVGNTVTVPSKNHGDISMANIFEYSTTRGKPFIKKTFEASVNEMAQACVNVIKQKGSVN